jgi:hypothetical protein
MTFSSEGAENAADSDQPSSEDAAHDPGPHHRADHAPMSSAQILLPIAVSAAVPLWIYQISQRGGPTAEDWQRLRSIDRLLAEQGEHLLFRSPREGETAHLFNSLAEALALLAFVPGGVHFGGQHFEALQILTHFLGAERASNSFAQIRQASTDEGRDDA